MVKYSRQRELVKQAVINHAIHPTAEEVYRMVHQTYPNISLGTVYRNLNTLVANGMLKKICMPEGPDRYDGRVEEHVHLLCTSCGCVSDVEIPQEALQKLIRSATNQHVTGYVLSLYGICNACYIKQNN